MGAVTQHLEYVGASRACEALGVARSSYHRRRMASVLAGARRPRPKPTRALAPDERQEVLALLHSERFMDKSPGQVVATQLDENRYLCSERTMYRILAAANEGLGTCWIAAFDPAAAREVLALPANVELVAVTPVGYPAETPVGPGRRPLEELVYYERWGQRG